jgi:hypothetical protein
METMYVKIEFWKPRMSLESTTEFNCRKCIIWYTFLLFARSRDSVIGMVTGYEVDDRAVGIRVQKECRVSIKDDVKSLNCLMKLLYLQKSLCCRNGKL